MATIKDEIRARQKHVASIKAVPDVKPEMARRFQVVPVLAVVIVHSKSLKLGIVAGILSPFAGKDLEVLSRDNDALDITAAQLRELKRRVDELGECGGQHGIWNAGVRFSN